MAFIQVNVHIYAYIHMFINFTYIIASMCVCVIYNLVYALHVIYIHLYTGEFDMLRIGLLIVEQSLIGRRSIYCVGSI